MKVENVQGDIWSIMSPLVRKRNTNITNAINITYSNYTHYTRYTNYINNMKNTNTATRDTPTNTITSEY